MKEGENITFHNRIEVKGGERRLKFTDRPDLFFSLVPKLGDDRSTFSPEDFFLSAINSCFFLTLDRVIRETKIALQDYESEAQAEVGKVGGSYRILRVVLWPRIEIEKEKDRRRLGQALRATRELCPVANALKIPVEVVPEINIVGQ